MPKISVIDSNFKSIIKDENETKRMRNEILKNRLAQNKNDKNKFLKINIKN
jgi:hypothetical protein